jgi:hypothetical protein
VQGADHQQRIGYVADVLDRVIAHDRDGAGTLVARFAKKMLQCSVYGLSLEQDADPF